MKNLVKSLFLLFLTLPVLAQESVPAPENDAVRYVLEIPKGGLKNFLRWTPNRIPMISHHRGGPAPGYPENAIETMDNALKYGPGLMEIDVMQLKDGTLVLMHDDTLDRTTTGSGEAKKKNWEEIKELRLKDWNGLVTEFRVPTLKQALRWAKGRAILTLDIKRGTDFDKVVKEVVEAGAEDYTAAIAYTHQQALAFHTAAPDMPISISARDVSEIKAIEDSGIPSDRVIAWTGTRLLSPEHYMALHAKGWRVIVGTLGGRDTAIDKQIAASGKNARYLEIFAMGADIIATDRFWAVQQQIRNPNLFIFTKKMPSHALN
ncbi:MAG: glycerophosphodiester phosphodiesterase family protein [Kordiimonas sp.]